MPLIQVDLKRSVLENKGKQISNAMKLDDNLF